jgi:hypothetical protein
MSVPLLRVTPSEEGGMRDCAVWSYQVECLRGIRVMELRPPHPAPRDPAGDHHKDRRGRRMPLSCRLFFFGEDDFEGEAALLDISANGCRASSSIPLAAGMILRLSLFLPDHQWPLRINQAIVRWIDNKEFGLEFTDITMAQRERLRALVMKAR